MEDRYLTLKQAKAISGRSVPTLKRAIAKDTLKAHKVGGVWLVKESDLRAYLEGR